MIFLELFNAFFNIGLFAVGGGLATVPFLFELSEITGWYSTNDLVRMIAVSESTPGPLGINMATYAGIQAAGFWGGIVATVGLITPMLFSIMILSHFLKHLRQNEWVKAVFQGVRPAIAMMILGFVVNLLKLIFENAEQDQNIFLAVGTFCVFLALTCRFKWHPIGFILFGAIVGITQSLLN